jgi:hypothetical protein
VEECFGQFDACSYDNLMYDQMFDLECENQRYIQNDPLLGIAGLLGTC